MHAKDGEARKCKIKEKLDIPREDFIVPAKWAEKVMKLYGLKACDTCRKAKKALETAGKTVEMVDIRDTPLDGRARARFLNAFGEAALINRRSTTWRALSEAERSGSAEALLEAHPTLMKRPVIEDGAVLTLGWDATAQAVHLGG